MEKLGRYDESEITSPLNIYAKTKLQGEQKALSIDGLVLRTNILDGQTMIKLHFLNGYSKI